MTVELDYLHGHPSMLRMREARARFLADDEIVVDGGEYLPIEGGEIWRRRRSRHVARQLNAWLFAYHLRPFHDDQDVHVARKLVVLLEGWREAVGLPPSMVPLAYHDEATAQRAIALGCLLDDYAGHLTAGEADLIRRVLREAADLLASDEFYSAGTNHGMYQDLALLAVSRHLGDGPERAVLATARLQEYFRTAFTADGIHREQSPEYHCIVSMHLQRYGDAVADIDPETAARFREIAARAEVFATMSISPLGTFAPVSDVVTLPVIASGYVHAFPSEQYRFAVSQGALGAAPTINRLIAEDTGVAVLRQDWGDLDSLYLYFSAAYTADYHKHADDLSLYVVHRGLEILREAGANGYQMDDPYTDYAFSSFAHNTLTVNGEGLPRTDPEGMDKVGLRDRGTGSDGDFAVEGWNLRFPGVEHRRDVSVQGSPDRPLGGQVLVSDRITAAEENDYELLWHLGPDVVADLRDGIVHLTGPRQDPVAEIRVRADVPLTLSVVSGQTDPRIQGWYFPEFGVPEPAQTLTVSLSAAGAEVHTDLTLL